MSNTHAGIRSRLSRPLPADARTALRLGTAAGAFLLVLSPAWLALVNLDGPFQEAKAPGAVLALLGAALAGGAALVAVDRVARRSGAAALALLVGGAAAGVVLLPRPIDQHESFLPQVNERFSCTGWSFEHYPPGVMDGTGTTYCVGLERRLPDG
jgi:hypothetical protein